jgi:hypothetical protein
MAVSRPRSASGSVRNSCCRSRCTAGALSGMRRMKLPVLCDDAAEEEEEDDEEDEDEEEEEEEEEADLSTAPLVSSTSSRPNVDMKI